MHKPDDIYSLLRYLLPSRIYYNKEYEPFLKAMSHLVANVWNDAGKIPEVFDVENMPDGFLKYLYEFWDYKYANFSYETFAQRMFLKNMMDILRKKGSERSIVSAVQFSIMNDANYARMFVPDVYIEQGGSGYEPWEYIVFYPMGYNIDRSLFEYVIPAGQMGFLSSLAHEDWWSYYYGNYGNYKHNADSDVLFTPKMFIDLDYMNLSNDKKRVSAEIGLEGKLNTTDTYKINRESDKSAFRPVYYSDELYHDINTSLQGMTNALNEIAGLGKKDKANIFIYNSSSEKYKTTEIVVENTFKVDYVSEYYKKPRISNKNQITLSMSDEDYRSTQVILNERRLNLSRSNRRVINETVTTRRVKDTLVKINI